jgi:hypothetical protein
MRDPFGELPLNEGWSGHMIVEMTVEGFLKDIPELKSKEAVIRDLLSEYWALAYKNGFAAGQLDTMG